jgi:DNA-binding MarR family transcriptional regulator
MAKQDFSSLPSAFKVLIWARNAGSTRGAQRELLYALILRCRKEAKYAAFPGYKLLAEDTGLHPITLKRAAAALIKAGIIKRHVRPNRSNMWFINVSLLQEQAAAREAEREERKRASQVDDESAPFPEPKPVSRKAADEEYEDNDSDDVFADREDL